MQEFSLDNKQNDDEFDFNPRWITSYNDRYTIQVEHIFRMFLHVNKKTKKYELRIHTLNLETEEIDSLVFYTSKNKIDVLNEKIRFQKWLTKNHWLGDTYSFHFEEPPKKFSNTQVTVKNFM